MQWFWLIYSYSVRDLARSDIYRIPQTETPNLSVALNYRQIQICICHSYRMAGTKLDKVHPWLAMHGEIQTSWIPHPMNLNNALFLIDIISPLHLALFILYTLPSSTTYFACILNWAIILSTQEAQAHLQPSAAARAIWARSPWALLSSVVPGIHSQIP